MYIFNFVTRWQYTSGKVLGSHKVSGIISTYGGGGYFMDFNITRDISHYTLDILKKNMWLDRASRLVIVDFALYNANINYFCFVQYVSIKIFNLLTVELPVMIP